MYQRPKYGESDEDLLKLQEEFNKHKTQSDFKLAAKLAKKDDPTTSQEDANEEQTAIDIQEHLDNTFEDIPMNIKIGPIMEKKCCNKLPTSHLQTSSSGFPQAKRRDVSLTGNASKGSIFSQQMKRMKTSQQEMPSTSMQTDSLTMPESIPQLSKMTGKSSRIQNMETDQVKDEIHQENLNKMNEMTSEEIMEERERLMTTLDPAIIAYLKSKRAHNQPKIETRQPTIAEQNKDEVMVDDIESMKELLGRPEADKWINFDMLESNKLAWMKDVSRPTAPKDEKYEARFDFAGWLLPYVQDEIDDRNRILYHHGEEPGRPGYTLQELFQLARSNVIQQKIIALNTIAAILKLYSSGIYDHIIDVPIEQVFFVLRFGLDENTPAILNAAIKALHGLFCNQIDETCLDCMLGFGLGQIQPILSVDDSADDNTVNDQQLAESNLVKCLLRSGILIRIRYIFNIVKPTEIETVINCLDILIRLARDSDYIVDELSKFDGCSLLESIIEYFIPKVFDSVDGTTAYHTPISQAVKLMRILANGNQQIANRLVTKYKILDSINTYLSNELLSLNTTGLKLQIESLRLWETFAHHGLGLDQFPTMRPILLRLFDYHIKQTNADASWTMQTHIAAILTLLASFVKHDYSFMLEFVKMLFEYGLPKWMTQTTFITSFSCGKLQVLSSVFKFLTTIHKRQPANVLLPWDTVYKLTENLILSDGFKIITGQMKHASNLLNNYEVRKSSANLKFAEAVAWNAAEHIVPILQTNSCIPFLNTLSEFVSVGKSPNLKKLLICHKHVSNYLKHLQSSSNFYLTANWFTKLETQMVWNFLNIAVAIQHDIDAALFYEVAVKSLCFYTAEMKPLIEFLFDRIIFCPTFYPSEVLLKNLNLEEDDILKTSLRDIANIQKVYVDVLGLQQNVPSFETKRTSHISQGSIMPLDWIYSPIIALYANDQSQLTEHAQNVIVANCLRWVYVYETYFPDLANMINATDKFCRLACTFLGSDSLFLMPEIQQLLSTCLTQILRRHEAELDFERAIHGLKSFQDLYTQLLEQYQGVSYGDKLFGQFLLVPLAQRHNVKFRKAVWSEYAAIVQIFNVTENDLLVDIKNYLEPSEEDISLLKCYHRLVSFKAVRQTCVFHKIAAHHVNAYKLARGQRK